MGHKTYHFRVLFLAVEHGSEASVGLGVLVGDPGIQATEAISPSWWSGEVRGGSQCWLPVSAPSSFGHWEETSAVTWALG